MDILPKIPDIYEYAIVGSLIVVYGMLQDDDGRSSGGSSPESTGSVETSISSHFGGMNYPSLFSSRPSGYGVSQQSVRYLFIVGSLFHCSYFTLISATNYYEFFVNFNQCKLMVLDYS